MSEEKYDSRPETQEHINRVRHYLGVYITNLMKRGAAHDASKLVSPELEWFDEATPRLAGLTYGTPEYHENAKLLKPALDHHYAHNSHHPQHYPNGINGMSLFDLVEMFADWKAAGERGKDGNIFKSIEINAPRFKMSDQLKEIFINTANELGYTRP